MPTVSSESAYDTTPQRLSMPYEGLKPYTPQYDAGMRTEPPVSVPSARRHSPAATAAAAPPELPPGARGACNGYAGLATGPYIEWVFRAPMANSSQLLRDEIHAPASRRRSTTVASKGARYSASMRLAHVVRTPFIAMFSLMLTDQSCSGPARSGGRSNTCVSALYGSCGPLWKPRTTRGTRRGHVMADEATSMPRGGGFFPRWRPCPCGCVCVRRGRRRWLCACRAGRGARMCVQR